MTFVEPITLNAGDRLAVENEGETNYYLATKCTCVMSPEDCNYLLEELTKEEFEAYKGSFHGWEEEEEYSAGYSTASLAAVFVLGLIMGLIL